MTEKELRRLSRADLLEMLLDQSLELQSVREKLETAEAALASRAIELDNAGSIAEASLRLNGVFEAAQAACDQYAENMRLLNERSEMICRRREQESREQAEKLLAETREKCARMEEEVRARWQADAPRDDPEDWLKDFILDGKSEQDDEA